MEGNHRNTGDGISFSQIKAASGCGERVRRKYIEGDRRPYGSLPLSKGSAVHSGIETDLRSRMQSGSALSLDDLTDVANQTLEEKVNAAPHADLDQDPDLEDSRKKVRGMLEGYQTYVAPTIGEVIGVEEKLNGSLQFGNEEYPLFGYIDAITVNSETGEIEIRDWKTSGSKVNAETQAMSLQWDVYSFLAQQNGYDTETVRIDTLRWLKTKGPQHDFQILKRGPAHHERLARVVAKVSDMYALGAFIPDPFNWLCHPNRCEYWVDCPYRLPDSPEVQE